MWVLVVFLLLVLLLFFVPVILLIIMVRVQLVISSINEEHVLLSIPDGVIEDLGLDVGLMLVVSPDCLFLMRVG
jgi:hypothetical protein